MQLADGKDSLSTDGTIMATTLKFEKIATDVGTYWRSDAAYNVILQHVRGLLGGIIKPLGILRIGHPQIVGCPLDPGDFRRAGDRSALYKRFQEQLPFYVLIPV